MPTTEAGIHSTLSRDLYIAIGNDREGEVWAIHTYVKPYIAWIWIGCLVMALGGCLSLSDRRYRVGASVRPKIGLSASAKK